MSANNGEMGLEMVKNEHPDLILLDVLMPGLSGVEVCEIVKTDEKTLSIPIIIVTTLSQQQDRINCIKAGADDFITKPVDRLEMETRVKSLLQIKRLHDNLLIERDRLDIKNSILSVLTEVTPMLMQSMPAEQQKIVILQLIDRVEKIILDKMELSIEKVDMTYLGNMICDIWSNLGGSFTFELKDGNNSIITGTEFPWGLQARHNPLLCQLTRGMVTRIARKVFPDAQVKLVRTIGNQDRCCLIEIHHQ
ncbi:MAG: methanogen output domain 1-containing protein [ANME-2 cluster archaeon]|nr:methanogen output domain 1-containing protein [ANME-2 cluster archaeon]